MTSKKNIQDAVNIIEALGRHPDSSSVNVLEEIGTNNSDEIIRELTIKALIKRNTHDSLRVVLINKGKGIHDLSAKVVETAINSLKSLDDKSEAIKILDDTISLHSDENVRSKAREIKEIISMN